MKLINFTGANVRFGFKSRVLPLSSPRMTEVEDPRPSTIGRDLPLLPPEPEVSISVETFTPSAETDNMS